MHRPILPRSQHLNSTSVFIITEMKCFITHMQLKCEKLIVPCDISQYILITSVVPVNIQVAFLQYLWVC